MVLNNTNEWKDVSRIFKGYLTIKSGSNLKKYDQLLELEITSRVDYVSHYSSQKQKNNAVVGQSSIAILKVDATKSLYGDDGTSDATLVTHITNKLNNELSLVSATFEAVEETDSSDSDKFIIHKFDCDIFRVSKKRDTGIGTFTTEFEVDITHEEHNKTSTTAPTTG